MFADAYAGTWIAKSEMLRVDFKAAALTKRLCVGISMPGGALTKEIFDIEEYGGKTEEKAEAEAAVGVRADEAGNENNLLSAAGATVFPCVSLLLPLCVSSTITSPNASSNRDSVSAKEPSRYR